MQFLEETNDDFLFIDDSDEDEIIDESNGDTWKVLIVDDDPEIHSVTQLALSDLIVLGRRLEYLHAYSGEDACQLIEQHRDIVLVLLDVVMETDDAGLRVVKHIRETLSRADTRIVLRTGQPGYAPEENVIKEYDINDYKTKTELTRRKLVTTVYAAIRSYQQIDTVSKNHQGLENIIAAAAELLEHHSVDVYAQGVLRQLKRITDAESGLFCARGQGIIKEADDLSLYVLAQNNVSPAYVNQKLEITNNSQTNEQITSCFQQKSHQFSATHANLYIASDGYRAVVHLELNRPLSNIEVQLIEVFLTNISIGYENVHLFQKQRNAAYKDWLTDLPNRLGFVHLLDDFSQSDDTNLVACLLDINQFSDINDGLGQDVGNQLLMAVAERLKNLGESCGLARVAADVFGVVGPAEQVNQQVLAEFFSQPFAAGEQRLTIRANFGFCAKVDASSRGVKVINQINIALNLAKKTNQTFFVYYQQKMEDETLWRLGMIRQLRNDFADNRLALWYQPQLNLTTGKVIGAEALLRWQSQTGEFITPSVFIPLAEYSGLIIEIGDWVINQACMQIKTLENHGFEQVGISVNVSMPQFKRDNFVERIIEAIHKHQIPPSKLELEITENVVMDEPQVVIDALNSVKKEGISIALDDFGTGFSSLSYLQQLPLDRLKVDRSFVADIAKPGKSLIADTIISLGKQMNLKVIAEGVEDEVQQAHLKDQGCEEVQGFYYAKAMPAEEFLQFLKNNQA
jgi:diguanylate cyclase (GGDEF)-like protein